MTKTAGQRISKARADLSYKAPFFASIAYKLLFVEDPNQPTLWTNGKQVGYNPSLITKISPEQVIAEVVHEIFHVAMGHNSRRGQREHNRWNVACDHAINIIIKEAGFQIGNDWLYDEQYKGMTAEAIYSILSQSDKKSGEGGQGDPSEGFHTPECGCGGLKDLPGKNGGKATKAEMQAFTEYAKAMLIEAATVAKMQGKLPAALEMFVENIVNPRLPWEDLMARFIEQVTRNDYCWTRPNRAYLNMQPNGFYLPTLYTNELGDVVVCLDESGSVGKEEMQAFVGETSGLLAQARPNKIWLMHTDADVHSVEELDTNDLPIRSLTRKCSGGTDFRPPFAWVEENEINPVCFIYLTDLECSSYPEEPEYPVLWISTTGGEAPFGETLHLEL
jgi:predicted metal-dependent peptidase